LDKRKEIGLCQPPKHIFQELLDCFGGSIVMQLSKPELVALLLYTRGKTGNIGEPVVGRTRLMKMVFLLLKEGELDKELDRTTNFKPYKYGPFDSEVYDALEALRELGIVEEKQPEEKRVAISEDVDADVDVDETYDADTEYKLTPIGIAKVERIARELPHDAVRKISDYKAIYNKKPLVEILHYVYSKFPEYAKLSEAAV
jgi:uncharacterized protein YwgA